MGNDRPCTRHLTFTKVILVSPGECNLAIPTVEVTNAFRRRRKRAGIATVDGHTSQPNGNRHRQGLGVPYHTGSASCCVVVVCLVDPPNLCNHGEVVS